MKLQVVVRKLSYSIFQNGRFRFVDKIYTLRYTLNMPLDGKKSAESF